MSFLHPYHSRLARMLTGLMIGASPIAASAINVSQPVFVPMSASGLPDHYCDLPRFDSFANHLIGRCAGTVSPGGDSSGIDVYVRDFAAATTVRVSVDTNEVSSTFDSGPSFVSDDGALAVFESLGALHPDVGSIDEQYGKYNVYVRDIANGTTELVSRAADGYGGPELYGARLQSVSFQRHEVLFVGYGDYGASPRDPGAAPQLYLRNWSTGHIERISVRPDGTPSFSDVNAAAMSGDGRYVVFASNSTDITGDNPGGGYQLFVRDRVLGTTSNVSGQWNGTDPKYQTGFRSIVITEDGRYVAFTTGAQFLATPGVGPFGASAYLVDRIRGTAERVSPALPDVMPGYSQSVYSVDMSDDGRVVGWTTQTNCICADVPPTPMVFLVRDRATGETVDVSAMLAPAGYLFVPSFDLSRDGRKLVTQWQYDPPSGPGQGSRLVLFTADISGVGVPRVAEIPALSRMGVFALGGLIGLLAIGAMRRRVVVARRRLDAS